MYENVCYKHPFLKEVIFRLDFGSNLEAFARALPQKLATAVLQHFPIFEPKKGQAQEILISRTTLQTKTEETTRWIYHGRNREKTLTVGADAVLVTNRKYDSFESFHKDVDHVLQVLFETQRELSISRLGLRYVNVLEIKGDDPLSWSEYVNEQMLGIIDLHKDAGTLSRVFHVIEFNYDGPQVKFQFGIPNPDYPAPIKRKQFVLDIDSFVHGALSYDDVVRNLNDAHERIQGFFENSITDKTRSLMEPLGQ